MMFDPSRQEDFERIGRVVEKNERVGRGLVDRLFRRWVPPENLDRVDWVSDADWACTQQEPIRARALLWAIVATFALLLGWSAFAPLDEVTRGVGKVVPSTGTQLIQSVDGGVVEEILVTEAQSVHKGQLLVRIDPTRFVANLEERNARSMALRARAARLEALVQGRPFEVAQDVAEEVPDLVRQERELYETCRNSLESQLTVARERLAQRKQELRETEARLSQASRTYELATKELAVTKPLLASGAVSELDVLRLEREISRARGDRDQARAQASRVRSGIDEAQGMIRDIELDFKNRWRTELAETLGDLGSLSEGSRALVDRVTHSEIRAPVSGTVKRVFVNTVGGVVMPGGEVIELVPHDDELVVEAKIAPKDRAFLRPGQSAVVKLTAYEYAIYGGLRAVVEHISADTITDPNGLTYYLARLRTEESGFGEELPILPGMMAQVDILTGKKTVLAYILKPILRAKANALRER